jgi:hypothetical protein
MAPISINRRGGTRSGRLSAATRRASVTNPSCTAIVSSDPARSESPQAARNCGSTAAAENQVVIARSSAPASVVCGYLHCDNPIFYPVVHALPPLFSARPPAGPAAE